MGFLSPEPPGFLQSATTGLHQIHSLNSGVKPTTVEAALLQPPAYTWTTRPGGAAGHSPGATGSRRPAPISSRRAQPSRQLRVLRRPPGLLAVTSLHHLAPASPPAPVLKLSQGTSSKGQKMGQKVKQNGSHGSGFRRLF
ncbi:uncharacterized protein ACOB7L_009973 [Callospermophilus lateralis]